MKPDRHDIEKEIRAIHEELGILSPAMKAAPSSQAESFDRITELYRRRKHLMAKLAESGEALPATVAKSDLKGGERRRAERRQNRDRRQSSEPVRAERRHRDDRRQGERREDPFGYRD